MTAVIATVASFVLVGPAAAGTPPADYGSSVQCRYRAGGSGPAYEWKLKRIVVAPPVLYANNGTQKVGWRFVVRRSLNGENGPWKVTYRSPIQKRTATATQAAQFDTQRVDVAIPEVENVRGVHYHVSLKMLWYRSGGIRAERQHLRHA